MKGDLDDGGGFGGLDQIELGAVVEVGQADWEGEVELFAVMSGGEEAWLLVIDLVSGRGILVY